MLRHTSPWRHVTEKLVCRSTALSQRRQLLTLAIETSCDDTCVAILERHGDPRHKSEQKELAPRAQLHFHGKITAANTGRGGIHPLEALESHHANLASLVKQAIQHIPKNESSGQPRDGAKIPDFISVTRGPGMRSNLSCGLNMAKGLAVAYGVPLVGVHHMQAHSLTPRLVHDLRQCTPQPKPGFPFLTLLVSGGHTMLVHSHSLTDHTILANGLDIAIGDCLDKCGRSILPESIKSSTTDTAYGKHLSSYAFPSPSAFLSYPVPARRGDELEKPLNQYGWQFQLPLGATRDLAFSFAGFASYADKLLSCRPDISDTERLLLARTVLGAAFEHLSSRIIIALQHLKDQNRQVPTLVVSGGVAANDFLRYFLRQVLDIRGFGHVELIFPPVNLCTDNAAMIAWAGMEMYEAGWRSELSIDALRKWSMDPGIDGGILGIEGWHQGAVSNKGSIQRLET